MKWLLSFLLIITVTDIKAQNFGVVCTYDYKQTLSDDDINNFDTANMPPLSYLIATNTADSAVIATANSFEDMMHGIVSRKNLVLYVHGDHSKLSLLLSKGGEFTREYDTDYLMFVWPSNEIENGSRKNYRNSKLNSMAVMPQFIQTIEQVSKYCEKNGVNLTVMFHSLGNLFAKNFARYSIEHNDYSPLYIYNVLLNAACVWENDHDIWVDILAKRARGRIFITQNEGDVILSLASTFIEKGDLLGKTLPRIKSINSTYIDFTEALKDRINVQESHGYFIGDIVKKKPELKLFYQQVFDGPKL